MNNPEPPLFMSAENKREWLYIVTERLGMSCEDREPTARDIALAVKAANEAVKP